MSRLRLGPVRVTVGGGSAPGPAAGRGRPPRVGPGVTRLGPARLKVSGVGSAPGPASLRLRSLPPARRRTRAGPARTLVCVCGRVRRVRGACDRAWYRPCVVNADVRGHGQSRYALSKWVCVVKAGVRRDRPASARARNHREPVATRIRVLGRLVVARRAGKPWIAH